MLSWSRLMLRLVNRHALSEKESHSGMRNSYHTQREGDRYALVSKFEVVIHDEFGYDHLTHIGNVKSCWTIHYDHLSVSLTDGLFTENRCKFSRTGLTRLASLSPRTESASWDGRVETRMLHLPNNA